VRSALCALLLYLQVHVQLLAYSELGDEFKDIVQEYAAVKVGILLTVAAAITIINFRVIASTPSTPHPWVCCCQYQILNSQQAEFVLAAKTHAPPGLLCRMLPEIALLCLACLMCGCAVPVAAAAAAEQD
jgi:hypothetical protein